MNQLKKAASTTKACLAYKEDRTLAGTIIGGKKAAEVNKAKYGKDFYAIIGAKGGKNGNTGGFASSLTCDCNYREYTHKYAECAGYKGGKKSRRGKNNV